MIYQVALKLHRVPLLIVWWRTSHSGTIGISGNGTAVFGNKAGWYTGADGSEGHLTLTVHHDTVADQSYVVEVHVAMLMLTSLVW
jgi:hypothetical protein